MHLMPEIDGPKKSWFEAPDGTKYIYTVYAMKAQTEYQCIQSYYNWLLNYQEPFHILVWRVRPEMTKEDDGWFKMYCRCVKLPLDPTMVWMPEKLEGDAVEIL